MSVSKIHKLYSPHRIAAKPPNSRKAPEKAQVMSEYISFGVIVSWHCSGLAAKGTMKPSCNGQLLCLSTWHRTTYLQEAYRDYQPNCKVMPIGLLYGQDDEAKEQ